MINSPRGLSIGLYVHILPLQPLRDPHRCIAFKSIALGEGTFAPRLGIWVIGDTKHGDAHITGTPGTVVLFSAL